MKKALILDLDNTIYPVRAIADNLFAELFRMLDENARDAETVGKIKQEMMRRPFQHIADEYALDEGLRNKMMNTLRNITYDLPMHPFRDYEHLRQIPLAKFLVTTGFPKLQYSKIRQLGIENDFKEIFVVDPDAGNKTKKDVFAEIMQKHNYQPEDLLVIGDDPNSEIKAALELGIDAFLFDPDERHPEAQSTHRSNHLKAALNFLE